MDSVGNRYKTLSKGQYFGEQALIAEDVRDFSAVAGADGTQVLTLDRDAISEMIGSIEDLINGKHLLDGDDDDGDEDEYAAEVGERHNLSLQVRKQERRARRERAVACGAVAHADQNTLIKARRPTHADQTTPPNHADRHRRSKHVPNPPSPLVNLLPPF